MTFSRVLRQLLGHERRDQRLDRGVFELTKRGISPHVGKEFHPYVASESATQDDVRAHVEARLRTLKDAGLVNPFVLYDKLARTLVLDPSIELRPARRLRAPVKESCLAVTLRVDVIDDVFTAIRAARRFARFGIPATFLLRHTAAYWGAMRGRLFKRHCALGGWLWDLVVAGAELDLMVDPFPFYFEYGVDGSQAVQAELRWVRSAGVVIRGVGSLSRAGRWGADSMEIFRGFAGGNRFELLRDDVRVPLQTLDLATLAVEYDSAFVRPRGELAATPAPVDAPYIAPGHSTTLDAFLAQNPIYEFTTDHVAWLVGHDSWVYLSNTAGKHSVQWPVSFGMLEGILRAAERPGRAILIADSASISGGADV